MYKKIITETKNNIKRVRTDDLAENIQKTADICNNIIDYYKRYQKISEKQLDVLERFNDFIKNFEFNNKMAKEYEKYHKEIEIELEETYF